MNMARPHRIAWIISSIFLLAAAGAVQAADSGSSPAAAKSDDVETPSLNMSVVAATGGDIVALATCTATAWCGVHPDVSCSGSSTSSTCTAVDRHCIYGGTLESGYVRCDGIVTACPTDSACTTQCQNEYFACIDACTNEFPCIRDCLDYRNYCECFC